ncbi:hypothetical protein MFLAVUS_001505 [Mucor flavus]|uniref:Major facilitator superfamily (MFS) profile domain-containing protein n=1 Tax=Mucor flavus TaxID=439312 RepID=A0ABP9YMQ8_9FUNG
MFTINVFYPFDALVGGLFIDRLGRKTFMASGLFIQAIMGTIVGATIDTQVLKPVLFALTKSTGDPLRARGYFIIIGILGGILILLYIPNMTHESVDTFDAEFRQML